MKFFISYCDDGQGLEYARKAKQICKREGIDAWVWEDDGNSAEWLKSDIANNVDSSDAMLTIITAGTENSEPQKDEWSLASSFGRINSSLRNKGLAIPKELRSKKCPEFSDSDFNKKCEQVIHDMVEYMEPDRRPRAQETTIKEYQLYDIAKQLEKRVEGLDKETLGEFDKSVWEGYLGSVMTRDIVRLAEAGEEDKDNLVNIAIRSSIDLDKFNAKDYWWGPAFKQLGADVANGEKSLLVERIEEEVEKIKEFCNEKNDELSIVLTEIERLNNVGHAPDVILAPPSMLKSFVHFFKGEKGKIDFARERGSAATLEVEGGIKLGIYLLGGGRLSENLIITNRSNIIWKFVPNIDTGYALTMGIGRGPYPDKVAFIIGTTVRCVIAEREGITRIPIEK